MGIDNFNENGDENGKVIKLSEVRARANELQLNQEALNFLGNFEAIAKARQSLLEGIDLLEDSLRASIPLAVENSETSAKTKEVAARIGGNLLSFREMLDANSAKNSLTLGERWVQMSGFLGNISRDVAYILQESGGAQTDVASTNVINLRERLAQVKALENLIKSFNAVAEQMMTIAAQWIILQRSMLPIIKEIEEGTVREIAYGPSLSTADREKSAELMESYMEDLRRAVAAFQDEPEEDMTFNMLWNELESSLSNAASAYLEFYRITQRK